MTPFIPKISVTIMADSDYRPDTLPMVFSLVDNAGGRHPIIEVMQEDGEGLKDYAVSFNSAKKIGQVYAVLESAAKKIEKILGGE